MGAAASVNTIVTDINNKVEESLKMEAYASANASCTVTINNIQFEETFGCTITVSNFCSADAVAQVDAVVNASISYFNDLTTEQKQEAPKWFTAAFGVSTTVNSITTDFKKYIEEKCKADSIINSDIKINNITVKKCTAPPDAGIVEFKFINAGKASGQCAVGALVDLQVSGSNIIASSQSQGFNWSSVIWPVVILGIVIVLFFMLYYMKNIFVMKPEDKIKLELAKHNNLYSGIILLNDSILNNKKNKNYSYDFED